MGNKSTKLNNNEVSASYTWKVPSMSKTRVALLVTGYIHEFESNPIHNNSVSIPFDIFGIFVAFFVDEYEIEKIKNAKPGDSFKSNIFGVDKFRFEIEICPNGEGVVRSDGYDDHGHFTLFINLLSIPPPISKISLKYDTSFLEQNIKTSDELEFSRNVTSYRWAENKLNIDKIQDLNTFTFKIDIKGIKLFYINEDDEDGNSDNKTEEKTEIINPQSINITENLSLPSGYFTWKLHDIEKIKNIQHLKKDDYISSELFEIASLKWIIKLYKGEDNKCNLCVYIVSLSPNITTLFVSYKITFYEQDIAQNGCIEFKENAITFWPPKLSNIEGITDLDTITVKLEITVLDAFDKDNNQISDIHALHTSSLLTETGRFIWKITDKALLDQIKSAPINNKFVSECFTFNQCKYCISIFPNGYNIGKDEKNEENNVAVFLNLLSTPPDIHHETLRFELILHETNTRGTNYAQFLSESFWGWSKPNIILMNENINSLTLEAVVTVIDVFNDEGISINEKYIKCQDEYEEEEKDEEVYDEYAACKIEQGYLRKYEWKIIDKKTLKRLKASEEGTIFISPVFEMFNLKWIIEFYPSALKTETQTDNIAALYISMLSMPKRVHSISMGYKLSLKETNTEDSNFVQFHDTSISIGWSRLVTPDTEIVKNLDELTFGVQLILLDIYDVNCNIITKEFVDDETIGKEIDISLGEYEWVIDKAATIKKIRNAEHSHFFRSPLFPIQGFKFFMQITPNGANPSDIGNFGCFLYVASLPPTIWKITLYYELLLVETNTLDCYATEATQQRTTCGWFRNLKFDDIKNMNKLTFQLKLGIVDVFDEEGIPSTSIDPNIQKKVCSNLTLTPYDKYVWKIRNKNMIKNIKNAKHMESFDGPIFGNGAFKFQIRLTPNGQNDKTKGESTMGIKLCSLPERVCGVSIFFELHLKETHTHWSYASHFRNNYLTQSWQTCRVTFAEIQNTKQLTLSCVISLIDVYKTS